MQSCCKKALYNTDRSSRFHTEIPSGPVPFVMKRSLFLGLVMCLCWPAAGCRKRPLDPTRPADAAPTAPAETLPPTTGIGPSQAPGAGDILLAGKKGKITLEDITDALRAYVISRQISSSKSITSLDVLVQHKFLPELPPPPPGKKYVWDKYSTVTLANK